MYTITCFLVQFLIPSIFVIMIYSKIMTSIVPPSTSDSHKIRMRRMARKKKTNRMLMMVSLVFFLSWAPLNVLNLALDIFGPFQVRLLA